MAISPPAWHPGTEEIRRARRKLRRWWRRNGRSFWWREQRDPYVTAVVEVLLKQTRATSSADRIRWFVERYPTPESLAQASLARLTNDLRPFGFHQQRAEHLKALGRALVLRPEALSRSRKRLLSLPGIGPYAANAIRCFVYGYREPVMDVNVARILCRVWSLRVERGEPRKNRQLLDLATAFVDSREPRETNWALLDLGALVCTERKPRCEACPLFDICAYASRAREPQRS
jgi:A/G-specific adenine glycosylase